MIRIEHVTKRYGGTVAVDDLTLHVRPGEAFGFLGPNGAGKTTTLKMLAGLLRPSEGQVSVAGFDLATHPLEAKMVTGYVPDNPFVYEKLTGGEFLKFVRDLYRVDPAAASERAGRLTSMFALDHRLDELVESYSHGMRQKLVITAALLPGPKALVIDEPMVGLDARGMRQVKTLFRELADGGATVLVSTHTMSVAEEICDRIGVLNKGRLVAVGSMEQLRAAGGGDGAGDLESVFLRLTEEPAAG